MTAEPEDAAPHEPVTGGTARIGISGWRYPYWRGTFYPKGLPQRRELEYASRQLPTIEVNGSFYSLQRPASWAAWRDTVPDDFVFAVKGGRYLTHMLRLANTRPALANFFAQGVLSLGAKLGPVLWQIPATLHYDERLLDEFLTQLPRTTGQAAALARGYDARLEGRTALDLHPLDGDRPLRHALEVRHESFGHPDFLQILRRHQVALVVSDSAETWPAFTEVTADFVYVRLHGQGELYVGGYTDDALDDWAGQVRGWQSGSGCPDGRGRDVFVYFDNDTKVRAPFDAMGLIERLRR